MQIRHWAWLRLVLGFAQMAMVAFSAALRIFSGVNRISLAAAVVTCLLTTMSVLLFGSQQRR